MLKILKYVLITAIALATLLTIAFFVLLHYAFGPVTTTGTIPLNDNKQLIYTEIYNADLGDWWYDVSFTLKPNNTIAKETFKNEDWKNNIEILKNKNEQIILIKDPPRMFILILNDSTKLVSEKSIALNDFRLNQYRNL